MASAPLPQHVNITALLNLYRNDLNPKEEIKLFKIVILLNAVNYSLLTIAKFYYVQSLLALQDYLEILSHRHLFTQRFGNG